MKKLGELGISPAPWQGVEHKNEVAIITSAGFDDLRSALCRGMNRVANARLIAAAPKLYGKAYEVAENLLVHLAVPSQTISMNRAEVAAMVKDLQSALAEAAGEMEIK